MGDMNWFVQVCFTYNKTSMCMFFAEGGGHNIQPNIIEVVITGAPT